MPRMPKPPIPQCEHYPVGADEDIKLKLLENKLVPRDLTEFESFSGTDLDYLIYLYKNGVSKTITIQNILDKVQGVKFEKVNELPETGETNIIYLLKNGDSYDQYVWYDNAWLNISSKQDLSAYAKTTYVDTVAATKQNIIADLDTIRSGAALGATALQEIPDTYATKQYVTDYHDATKQDVLSIEQQAAVNSGIDSTKVATYDAYAAEIAKKQDILSAEQLAAANSGITVDKVNNYDNYAAQIAGKQDIISDLDTIRSGAALGSTAVQPAAIANFITKDADNLTNYTKTSDLATVAKTNSYNDLDDKPTIPSIEGLATETYVNAQDADVLKTAEQYTNDYHDSTKQDSLSTEQLAAANSGISATKVSTYDNYATEIAGKQAQLSDNQLAATNSGITSEKVAAYDAYATTKQDVLTAGNNVTIDANNVISAIDTTYTAGDNVEISSDNVISALDQTIEKDFTTAVAVGNLPKNSQITSDMTLREILYTILSKVAVTSISLDKYSVSIEQGKTSTVTATILPENATNKDLTWSVVSGSDHISLSTYNEATTTITAKSAGTATLRATSSDDPTKIANCTVTVTYTPVSSITLAEHTKEINIGNSETLTYTLLPTDATNKNVTWTSSNTSVATVSAGKVVGKTEGTANITVASVADSTKYDTCVVTVSKIAVTSVTLNTTAQTISAGDTYQLTATVLPTNATYKTVTWASSDTNVATVDSTGKVTAISAGTVTISATADGIMATATITVTPNEIDIYYGATDEIPTDLTNLTRVTVSKDTLLADAGYEQLIVSGNPTAEVGQYPVFAIPNTLTVSYWGAKGFEADLPRSYVSYTTYDIHYIKNQAYDEPSGSSYIIKVKEK